MIPHAGTDNPPSGRTQEPSTPANASSTDPRNAQEDMYTTFVDNPSYLSTAAVVATSTGQGGDNATGGGGEIAEFTDTELQMTKSQTDPKEYKVDHTDNRESQQSSFLYDLSSSSSSQQRPPKKVPKNPARKLLGFIQPSSHERKKIAEGNKNDDRYENEIREVVGQQVPSTESHNAAAPIITNFVTDEEEQQNLSLLLTRLQEDVRELKSKTNNEVIHNKIRDLRDKFDALEMDMQGEIALLKQQLRRQPRGTLSPSLAGQFSIGRASSKFYSDIGEAEDGLPQDTFSLMMISPILSKAWFLGMCTVAFQLGLVILIGGAQLGSFRSDIPFKVDRAVHIGQLLTIIFAVAWQNDVTTSIRFLVMFWNDPLWDRTILGREERSPPPTTKEWVVHIVLPNIMKFLQGIFVLFNIWVYVVQSEENETLLAGFLGLMVTSETDNLFFFIAANGFFGSELQKKTIEAQDVKIQYEVSRSNDSSTSTANKGFLVRPVILFLIAVFMIGGWFYIVVIGQTNGYFFDAKYPKCSITYNNQTAFELAKEHFGDGECYGGHLNSLECAFEGGDCIDFNIAYPLCKGKDLIDVGNKVGNNECDPEFNNAECGFDGGDCGLETRYPNCPHIDLADEHFGDGICFGGPLNTFECGFEAGDCYNFHLAYPLCKGNYLIYGEGNVGNGKCDIMFAKPECDYDGGDCCTNSIINSPLFGDGTCHVGYATAECGYDNGDCNDFIRAYPACPLSELRQIEGASDAVLGNGICDSGVYSSAECGWKHGDCNIGQKGQNLDLPDILSFDLSLDGNLIIGASSPDNSTEHKVEVYHYDESKMIWGSRGSIPNGGSNETDGVHLSVTLNQAGDRITVGDSAFASNAGLVKIFDYISPDNAWVQVGQSIQGPNKSYLGSKMDMTGDGSRLAVSAPFASSDGGEYSGGSKVFIYEFNNTRHHWDLLGNAIEGRTGHDTIGLLFVHISALDGNTVMFSSGESTNANGTRIFRYNHNNSDWIQIGSDIPCPFSHDAAMSSNGDRIAVSPNVTREDAPGQVHVYDYDETDDSWMLLTTLLGTESSNGNGFGYSVALSNDGAILSVGSVDPKCDGDPGYCATGNVQIYVFDYIQNDFIAAEDPTSNLEGNMMPVKESDSGSTVFGSHLSMSGDGSTLSVGGYNFDENRRFVNIYDLDQLFDSRCLVNYPKLLGDGRCSDDYPYNSKQCRFDSGDCLRLPVEGYPGCLVSDPEEIGNGNCYDRNLPMYNTTECGYDGGDCLPKPVDGYPGCYLPPDYHYRISNGYCDSSYNSKECGYDGGDCIAKPVKNFPGCYLLPEHHDRIGNGVCNSDWYPSYNSTECGYDGGDCLPKPVDGYPGCLVIPEDHFRIGNEYCHPSYNTTECDYDGGDCVAKPVKNFPGCYLLPQYHYRIDNGRCDPSYNSTECGYDGGDCLP